MNQKWKQLREKISLVRIYDPHQKKALGNLTRFFAWMIVLTLVARAASNASVPQVQTAFPGPGTIAQEVDVQGTLDAAEEYIVECPAGLTVVSLLCKEGEKVTAGQSIVQLDSDEIALTLEREKAELHKLQVQKSQLQDTQEPDGSAVSSAQQQLNWAYEDQEKARQTLENLQKAETPDEQAIAQAQQEYESAVRAAQSAENVRNSALAAYEEQKLQNEKSAAANQADAAVLQVDIREKQETIEALSSLQEAGGTISAPRAGTLLSWELTEGSVSGAQACTIADAEQGYEMNFSLSGDSAQKVQLGAQVQVTQDSQTETAVITALTTVSDDGSVDVTVRLAGQQWSQGTASGKLLLSQTEHDLCVPAQAVHSDNRGTFVYVLEERETVLGIQNVLMRVPVEVVETGRVLTAVSSAMLETTSQAVVSSTKPLSEGASVRVVES